MNINYKGTYFKLSTIKEPDKQCSAFLSSAKMTDSSLRFYFDMEKFSDIPDQRFVFWMTDKLIDVFNNSRSFESVAKPRQGMATSDNDRFLRMWYEVDENKVCRNAASSEDALNSGCKWFPYNKGGGFRKWYGNNYYLLNYENDGKEVKDYAAKLYKSYSRTIKNIQFYFKKCVTWSDICGSTFAARACTEGYIFDVKGSSAFVEDKYYNYILALLNSNVCVEILNMLNPSITTQVGDLKQMPFIFNSENASQIATLAQKAVGISKWDWDNYEISTDFQKHPLLFGDNIERAYTIWSDTCTKQFTLLKETEETINELFIRTYGLDNISVLSDDKDIAVRLADLKRDVKSLLSYAVGCMFGRYSLDVDGVAYAGGDWDDTKYSSFIPDKDNCIPITDEEYFEDDIVGRLVNFIKAAYGENTVEENLDFIAKALGNKGNTSREVIRNYFLNDFIKDHIKTYQKRPIYWMFDSGKQNGFKSLVYMHRWNADTTGNMRIEYLHRMQKVYEKEIERMQEIIDNSNDNKDISYANKRKEKLQKQLKETKDYDSLVAHLALSRIDIDLDDGVKVNYEKVQTSADGKKLQILTKF